MSECLKQWCGQYLTHPQYVNNSFVLCPVWNGMPILRDKGSKVRIDHTSYPYIRYTVKKVSGFPVPSRKSLVSDIPDGDGKTANLFLQCRFLTNIFLLEILLATRIFFKPQMCFFMYSPGCAPVWHFTCASNVQITKQISKLEEKTLSWCWGGRKIIGEKTTLCFIHSVNCALRLFIWINSIKNSSESYSTTGKEKSRYDLCVFVLLCYELFVWSSNYYEKLFSGTWATTTFH